MPIDYKKKEEAQRIRKKSKQLLCFFFFCVLSTGLLTGCAAKPTSNMIYTTSGHSGPISQLFPEYKIADHTLPALDLLHSGGIIEAYDAQAETGAAKYWYPLTLETIVIAVDRDQTEMAVATWSSLRRSSVTVSILNAEPVDRRMMAAAICYGLEGKNFSLYTAGKLFQSLYQNGNLAFDDPSAAIQICFDSDAATRVKNGENIEIVIPSEGTLSYVKGLLSEKPLDLPDGYKQVLQTSGSRLPDGSCDGHIYPASGQYTPARVLGDYTHLSEVTQGWRKVMNRQVQHIWLYSGANLREDVLFTVAVIIIAVMWVASLMRRSQQKNIRQVIFTLGVILSVWILIHLLKWQIYDETVLGRYLWFSYYLFEIILTLGLLRIASLIGTGSGNNKTPKWFWALCAYSLVLGGMIMTNDLHGLMFKLDLSQQGWSSTGVYGYGVLYYIFTASLLAEMIGGIALMFVKVAHSPRRAGVIFPIIFTAVLVTYIVGYDLNIPFFAKSDITLVLCLFALIFLEICIRAGQLPVNTNYRDLFKNAGLNLQITDGGGNSVLVSNDAEPLNSDQWSVISDQDAAYTDENTLLRKNKISGGYAVWREDVTAINRLLTDIESSNREIEATNILLSGEARSKEQAARANTRLEIYSAFEKDIAVYEKRLSEMLGSTSPDNEKYAESMKKAAILTCYIKRRSYFQSMIMENRTSVTFNEFVVYIDEMAELARLAGIQCLTYCDLTGEISLRQVMLFYDFWASLLEWAVTSYSDGIAAQTISGEGRIMMRLRMSDVSLKYELPGHIDSMLSTLSGLFEKIHDSENLAVLRLSFPEGGERGV